MAKPGMKRLKKPRTKTHSSSEEFVNGTMSKGSELRLLDSDSSDETPISVEEVPPSIVADLAPKISELGPEATQKTIPKSKPETASVSIYVPRPVWKQLKLSAFDSNVSVRVYFSRMLESVDLDAMSLPTTEKTEIIHTTVELCANLWNDYRRAALIRGCKVNDLVLSALEERL